MARSFPPPTLLLIAIACCMSALQAARDRLPQKQPDHKLARQLHAVSEPKLLLPSCKFNTAVFPPRCESTYAPLMKTDMAGLGSSFAERATAFTVASKTYCSTFSRDECNFPCAYSETNKECNMDSRSFFATWACPGSQVRSDSVCAFPEAAYEWCSPNDGCTLDRSLHCSANFKAGMDEANKVQWMEEYSSQRRSVWGCCEGSNALWLKAHQCSKHTGADNGCTACSAEPGCRWTNRGECEWIPSELVKRLFVSSPLSTQLSQLATECDAISSSKRCNNYKPVEVNWDHMQLILHTEIDELRTDNVVMGDSSCMVWQ